MFKTQYFVKIGGMPYLSKMGFKEVWNKETGEKFIGIEEPDYEMMNPLKHFQDSFVINCMVLKDVPIKELVGETPKTSKSKKAFKESMVLWENHLAEILSIDIPSELWDILGTHKKRHQEKLLRRVTLTPKVLEAFILKAYIYQGYLSSKYSSEFHENGLDRSTMPHASFIKENGEVEIMGNTDLSPGKIKHTIKFRKVKNSRFIEKDGEWHCFFTTFKSLRGEEKFQGVYQPHFHYISNAFGIDREKVVEQIQSRSYRLPSLPHIKFEGYPTR